MDNIPVITIDGPSGSGKGTLSQQLAKHLHWHFLDSGSLYRILALAAGQHLISFSDEQALANLAKTLAVEFLTQELGDTPRVLLDTQDVTHAIRTESCGKRASCIAVFQKVRQALLERQRAFKKPPGLVTDGRDMGTIIFPDAVLKIYLDASVEERAKRRHKQLLEKDIHTSFDVVKAQLIKRDQRDKTRSIAPLNPASDAIIMDTTGMTIETVFNKIIALTKKIPGV